MNRRILSLVLTLVWGVVAVVAAGWGAAVTAAPAHAPAAVTDLRINEFMASNTSTITDPVNGTFADWIEIYNMGATDVDLQGLYLSDDPALPTKHLMSQSLIVPAGGYVLLWAINAPPVGPEYVQFALGAGGEDILIVDVDGTTVIDSVTFGAQTADVSEARIPDGTGAFVPTNFPTPGQPNAQPPSISDVAHTPPFPTAADNVQISAVISDDGSVASAKLFYSVNNAAFTEVTMIAQGGGVYATSIPALANGTVVSYYVSAADNLALTTVSPAGAPADTYGYVVGYVRPTLVINEFAAQPTPLENPDLPANFPDWIEIYNYGSTAVSLDDLFLTDSLNDPRRYAIPDGLTVPANEYIIFYADGQIALGPRHTNFALGAAESVGLYGARGFDAINAFNYTAALPNVTKGRLPNGTGDENDDLPTMTPGRSNELLYNVSHTPSLPTSAQVVEVTAVIVDGMGTVDSATLFYNVDNGIPFSLTMSQAGNNFTADIPNQPDGSVVRYHIEASYTNPVNFDTVGLLDKHGYVVGYTPPELYINEFMAFNTATYSDTAGLYADWIEIYNPNPAPVSLAGLYLTDNHDNPTKFPITSTLSVPANGFILFFADTVPVVISNTAEANLYTGFGLSQGGGEDVALYGAEGFVLVDGVSSFAAQAADVSYGRTTDGNPIFQEFVLNTAEYPSPLASNDRRAPIITDVVHAPTFPTSIQTVTITADITDNGTVQTATLSYRQEGAGVFTTTALSLVSGDTYQAVLPAYPNGTTIEYYLTAEDDNFNSTSSPADAPTTLYEYTVFDTPPPIISNVFHTPAAPNSTQAVVVRADITATLALSETTLFYRQQGGGAFASVEMIPTSGDQFAGTIPAQADGTTMEYYVQAADADDQTVTSPSNAPTAVYTYTVTDPLDPPPTISNVGHTPNAPLPVETVLVTADITSTIGLSETTLFYREQGAGSFTEEEMVGTSGNEYEATIPTFPAGTVVEYYVLASDTEDQTAVAPAGAPAAVYSYTVAELPEVPDLLINEFMALNLNGITDPAEPSERPDWIEIYNPTAENISLDGLYLTNNLANPMLFPIPTGLVVPAGGYLLFYADGEAGQGSQHTNFTLNNLGGAIGLYGGSNGVVPLDTHSYGVQGADVSEGRYPNGEASFRKFRVPTPGAANVLHGPVIGNPTRTPAWPGAGEAVTIQTTVTDDGPLVDVLVVTLRYRVNGGGYTAVSMTEQTGNVFRAQIPAQALGAVVEYYIEAEDGDAILTTNPANPNAPYSYTVGELPGFAIYLPLVMRP